MHKICWYFNQKRNHLNVVANALKLLSGIRSHVWRGLDGRHTALNRHDILQNVDLTHRGQVMHISICVSKMGYLWVRECLLSVQLHYLSQCWPIVIWTLRNKHEWGFNWMKYFIPKKSVWNVVCKMAVILAMVTQQWFRSWVKEDDNIIDNKMSNQW